MGNCVACLCGNCCYCIWAYQPEKAHPYTEFLEKIGPHVETGDLLLFATPDREGSEQKVATDSPWTHVAFLYKKNPPDNPSDSTDPTCPSDPSCPFLIMEAMPRIGVALRNPKDRLQIYFHKHPKAFMAFRKLNVTRTPAMLQAVEEMWIKQKDKPYVCSRKDQFDSACACCRWCRARPDDTGLFCSELVAYLYIAMGLMISYEKGGKPPSGYMPTHFSSDHVHKHPKLFLDASWGPEEYFKNIANPPPLPAYSLPALSPKPQQQQEAKTEAKEAKEPLQQAARV